MSGEQLLLTIGALVLSVLTYFAGVLRTERRHAADGRATRTRRVFDQYMALSRNHITGGYDGLLKAGVAALASNVEVAEVVRLIVAHGEGHPLGSNHDTVFEGVDLLRLFKYAADKRVDFHRTPVEDIIRASRSKS